MPLCPHCKWGPYQALGLGASMPLHTSQQSSVHSTGQGLRGCPARAAGLGRAVEGGRRERPPQVAGLCSAQSLSAPTNSLRDSNRRLVGSRHLSGAELCVAGASSHGRVLVEDVTSVGSEIRHLRTTDVCCHVGHGSEVLGSGPCSRCHFGEVAQLWREQAHHVTRAGPEFSPTETMR